MKKISLILLSILLFSSDILAQNNRPKETNLIAFSKLYGYTRYFCPTDESANLDWNKFTVYAVNEIKNCKNDLELKESLTKLFYPISPMINISNVPFDSLQLKADKKGQRNNDKMIAWQHFGVKLGARSNIYKSIRTVINSTEFSVNDQLKQFGNQNEKIVASKIYNNSLFNTFSKKNELYYAKLNEELFCCVPLTAVSKNGKIIDNNSSSEYDSLVKRISQVNISNTELTENERLANVIIAWNVVQHFYPYFDVVKVDWNQVLLETLRETFLNKSNIEFYFTLRKMIAKINDGHGAVFYSNKDLPIYGLSIRTELIENKIVVTASLDTLITPGDIINRIDGKTGLEELAVQEKYISGSDQLRRFRALNMFGSGSLGSTISFELERDGKEIRLELKRGTDKRDMFYNMINPFNYPHIFRIENGIYYVNLLATEDHEMQDSLDKITNAKGIIFDWRNTSKRSANQKSIMNISKLLGHFTKKPIKSPKWNVPTVIYPDRNNLTFFENDWSIYPLSPYINAKMVFITEPSVVSYGETIMGIVENYKLADIVGDVTAGTNGNINIIPLLGGFEVMFTGMKVLKHDGTQHHLVGIKPTYEVLKSVKAVREKRDEYFEKAVEIIKKAYH